MSDEFFVLTKQDKIKGIADRYIEQISSLEHHEKHRVYRELLELDETATAQEVDEIIGDSSWTEIACGICEESVDRAIVISGDDRYYGNHITLCKGCLSSMMYAI